MALVTKTPAVYIQEIAGFANSVVEVETAVPAFIGYTETALKGSRDLKKAPLRISSMSEFIRYFGKAPKTQFDFAPESLSDKKLSVTGPFKFLEPSVSADNPTDNQYQPHKRFYLYYALRMFFDNGGGSCFIVSVGDYESTISAADLEDGLRTLVAEPVSTMIVVPDAMSLSRQDFNNVAEQVLSHCKKMQSRVAILDVFAGDKAIDDDSDPIGKFRDGIGTDGLDYGAAYYPWLETSVVGAEDIGVNYLTPDAANILRDALTSYSAKTFPPIKNPKKGAVKSNGGNDAAAAPDVEAAKAAEAAAKDKVAKATDAAAKAKTAADADPSNAEAAANAAEAAAALADANAEAAKAAVNTSSAEAAANTTSAKAAAAKAAANASSAEAVANAEKARAAANAAAAKATAAPNDAEAAANAAAAKSAEATANVQVAKAAEAAAIADAAEASAKAGAGKTAADADGAPDPNKTKFDNYIANLLPKDEPKAADDKAKTKTPPTPEQIQLNQQAHQAFTTNVPFYRPLMEALLDEVNLLPPSGAMAGIYARTDFSRGVFKAPAGVSVSSAVAPFAMVSFDDQQDLNEPLDGKAINAIRAIPGYGVMVWGARTLNGNSQDTRYINVRRTMIMLEQSIKNAAQAYMFEPNTATTWVSVESTIANFLTSQWKAGALFGATPAEAFSVSVGLGLTMTSDDIVNGLMNVMVKVAIVRPAEFIVLTFQQTMPNS